MATLPKKTSSGRVTQMPYEQVSQCLNTASNKLSSCLKSKLDEASLADLKSIKTNLSSCWKYYYECKRQIIDILTKDGCHEELEFHQKTFVEEKSKAKHFSTLLMLALHELSEDRYSDIDNLSDITSVSKMTKTQQEQYAERLRRIVDQRDNEAKLIELKFQEQLLLTKAKIEAAHQEQELARKEYQIKTKQVEITRDQDINKITSQFLDFDTDFIDDKEHRTGNWVSETKATNFADVCDPHGKGAIPKVSMATTAGIQYKSTFDTQCKYTKPSYVTFTSSNEYDDTVPQTVPLYSNANNYNYMPQSNIYTPTTTSEAWQNNRAPHTSIPHTLRSNAPNDFQQFFLTDPASRYLALSELKRVPPAPYSGDPQHFQSWISSIENRLALLTPSPLDQIDVFEAHTVGAPRELVRLYKSIHSFNPQQAVTIIKQKLRTRFGNMNDLAVTLKSKISSFPEIRGGESNFTAAKRLRELADLCALINAQMPFIPDLQTLNYFSGLEEVRRKLPDFMNNKWRSHKAAYTEHYKRHPPFQEFCDWLERQADILCSDMPETVAGLQRKEHVKAKERVALKTEFSENSVEKEAIENGSGIRSGSISVSKNNSTSNKGITCPLHRSNSHDLRNCYSFKSMNPKHKKLILNSYEWCLKCFMKHATKNCETNVKCDVCQSSDHPNELHVEQPARAFKKYRKLPSTANTKTACCTNTESPCFGRSCSKTLLVEVFGPNSDRSVKCYAILDEQSNQSFVTTKILDDLDISSPIHNYQLTTLTNQKFQRSGRIGVGMSVRGATGQILFKLPPLFENDDLPDTRQEVATPELVARVPHISHMAAQFLPLDEIAEVGLLIGRDAPQLLATRMVQTPPPYVHETPIGFAVVGSVCPESSTEKDYRAMRTHCDYDHLTAKAGFPKINGSVFTKFKDDDEVSQSVDDKKFLNIISNNVTCTDSGNLQFPLPFRSEDVSFPDNREAVFSRQLGTLNKLKSNANKLKDCLTCMEKFILGKHVEKVPPDSQLGEKGKSWFLPIFPVTHPKKLKVRLVFDSAASYNNVSLNSKLLSGPDHNNQLYAVLIRFREKPVAFLSDIESMFHCFYVIPEHRDFMRFYWFDGNDPNKPLVQYRSCVHIFGNTSSPSIAMFGLRKVSDDLLVNENNVVDVDCYSSLTGECDLSNQNLDTYRFLTTGFYVDDGLYTTDTPRQAVKILHTAKQLLSKYNIRLHKIVSNSREVLSEFPDSDLGITDNSSVEIDAPKTHRTLGISWNYSSDNFTVQVSIGEKPFTKRGLLSTVNSIFDPIGFVSPVVLEGRLMQRAFISSKDASVDKTTYDWDDELPVEHQQRWYKWVKSLQHLSDLRVQRCYTPPNFGDTMHRSLHVYSDASKDSIGHVIYLRSINRSGDVHVSFVTGDSKVAPRAATSIPRLELCAAVGASQAAAYVQKQLSLHIHTTSFYTDSEVIIAYLKNEQRRFTNYVTRRVSIIRNLNSPSQWFYVSSNDNPADIATRPCTTKTLLKSTWLSGPEQLWRSDCFSEEQRSTTLSVQLPETVEENIVLHSQALHSSVFAELLHTSSSWNKVCRVSEYVIKFVRKCLDVLKNKGHTSIQKQDDREYAVQSLLKEAQREAFGDAIATLNKERELPAKNSLAPLTPFLDNSGLLRVGGRLQNSDLTMGKKHPILLPRDHSISRLLVSHYHAAIKHQGRHITHGALINAGYYVQKGKSLIKRYIRNCVTCNRLRRAPETQIMANLPADRLASTPPFMNTGMDVMGPWTVYDGAATRRTTGGKKVWAILFTCLASRAVHVDILPSLDTTSMKNAISRFMAVRGNCKILRSDRGTNFVAANKELDISQLSNSLKDSGCSWIFNTPHASHHGGVWERKVGQVKRSMDAALLQLGNRLLSRDEFYTLLVEAASIVNSTPMWDISSCPDDPVPLSPGMLLTLRESVEIPTQKFSADDLLSYGKRRWRRVQHLADEFWKAWRTHYLQMLQVRQKWTKKERSLQVGDVVLVVEKNLPRKDWNVGVITSVKCSSDNFVRTVTVKHCSVNNKLDVKYT